MVNTRDFYETTRDERIALAKEMNESIIDLGDELIWSDWIQLGIPDEAIEEDYEWFADDEWEWADLCRLYRVLWEEGMKDD